MESQGRRPRLLGGRSRAVAGLAAAALVAGLALAGHASAQTRVPAIGRTVTASSSTVTAAPSSRAANGLGTTPQMGWNDWNAFGCNVNASLVEATADAMVADGMKADGYDYVNIDDCWLEPQRGPGGQLVPDPAKFPDGIKPVADYVHSKGLKFGIYEDAGTATCAGYAGSLGHEQQDAQTFASWGVDYLKYDNCNNDGSSTTQQYIDRYTAMADALKATGRPIFYAICEQGTNQPWTWAAQVGNSWRTTDDISDSYDSMLSIFQQNVFLYPYAGPGGWNDPDMLEIGNGGMTTAEYQTEFSLWAEMAAPLLAGTDLTTISKADLAIYTNKKVIAVDQDALGKQGVPIPNDGKPAGDDGIWVLSKPLANGGRSVVLFNSAGTATTISTTAAQVGMPHASAYRLDNLWTSKATETAGTIAATVPAHGVVMYDVSAHGASSVAPDLTLSLSGLPGAVGAGQSVTATVTVANDGVATASDLAIGVTAPAGWSVTPASPPTSTTLRSTHSASQTFTLTAGTSSGPLQAGQVSATAQFTWDGRAASVSASVPVTTAAAVQAPYQTYSSATDATSAYGQAGEQFGIEGAGTDLYSGTDDYSTIYQSGVAGTDSTIQTEVTSQQDMAGFAKAGIIVRNDMTASGSAPEGVILYESPSGGIQLEWDDNGGPWIDNVTPDNGTIPDSLPVYLKLTRDGSTYTGYYSTDGSTWQTVGSVSVPDQASTQDAGMFVTSHAAGSLGEVLFNGFSVS